ncbi:MAG: CBS domain-containing protein [Steroidobacteraceae bacterium]
MEILVNRPYLLAQQPSALPPQIPRARALQPHLRLNDPAVRAMSDFLQEPPRTIPEDATLEEVIDHMFRLGVRAFLVVRDSSVVGLITADDARSARRARARSEDPSHDLRAADVMTPSLEVPAIDWLTLQDSRISDLLEIFDGTGVKYLVVLQTETATWSTVRGLIHRARLERQLLER